VRVDHGSNCNFHHYVDCIPKSSPIFFCGLDVTDTEDIEDPVSSNIPEGAIDQVTSSHSPSYSTQQRIRSKS
jgi:hypothetical protein